MSDDPGPTTTTTTTTEVTTTYTGPSTTVPGPPEGIGWNRSGHESLAVDRWPERRSEPPGSGEDIWQDYAVVRYSFNTTIDALRKNAFRDAVDMWRDKTCVNFVEEENPARPPAARPPRKKALSRGALRPGGNLEPGQLLCECRAAGLNGG
ncbi:unnamed protein product [Effrenium voratum]|nr:unnamed protein product [Effrenium voratum]